VPLVEKGGEMIPYCGAGKHEVTPEKEKHCIEIGCPWLMYVCPNRVTAEIVTKYDGSGGA